MIVNRSEEERRAIAAEVIAARGAQPITRAAQQAGITPVTWRRIEAGLTVREDILERVSAYVSDRTHKPPQTVADATDEQLLAELGRRLAARHNSGVDDGASIATGPNVSVSQDENGIVLDVSKRTQRARRSAHRNPSG